MPEIFEWDDAKAEANSRKHGVGFEEAQSVFLDELAITLPDPDHSDTEERLIILGMSNQHRLLVVSFAERGRRIRLISARKATRAERLMKKKASPKTIRPDDMRAEYDFSGGVRNKYARTLKENGYTIRVHHSDGTVTEKRILGEKAITLEPDVREYFPDSKAVNRALRTLISIIPDRRKAAPKKSAGGRKLTRRKRLRA